MINAKKITILAVSAVGGFIAAMAIALAISGFYQVRPGEAAALQTFGAARAEPVAAEGLHWHWPWPVGKTTVIQVSKNRKIEVGFQFLPEGVTDPETMENWQRDPKAATMITGDLSLLETQLVAHYVISDLNDYLFRADDPGIEFTYFDGRKHISHRSRKAGRPDGRSLQDALEIAMRRAIGQRTIDQALVQHREDIERETMETAQEIINSYHAGLRVTSVQMQEIRPPAPVQDAFDDVLRAREEKEKRINEALAFENQTLPVAEGQAARMRQQAQAYKATRIAEATAEADRFLNILAEYRAAPDIIATRMYLQTVDAVLPHTRQIILTGDPPPTLILSADQSRSVLPLPMPTSEDE